MTLFNRSGFKPSRPLENLSERQQTLQTMSNDELQAELKKCSEKHAKALHRPDPTAKEVQETSHSLSEACNEDNRRTIWAPRR